MNEINAALDAQLTARQASQTEDDPITEPSSAQAKVLAASTLSPTNMRRMPRLSQDAVSGGMRG